MSDQNSTEFLPAVRRARIDRLNIYEVSDTELQILERGSPESLFLNFAILLLSVSASFLVALVTTDISSPRTFAVFVIVTIVGFIIGALLLALWAWHRRSTVTVLQQIRRRMPPEGIPSDPSKVIDADTKS
jgi:hypothetical protein